LWSVSIVVDPNSALPSYHYSVVKVLLTLSQIITHSMYPVKLASNVPDSSERRVILPHPAHTVKELTDIPGAVAATPLVGPKIITRPTHLVKDLFLLRAVAGSLLPASEVKTPLSRLEMLTHPAPLVKDLLAPGKHFHLYCPGFPIRREILTGFPGLSSGVGSLSN